MARDSDRRQSTPGEEAGELAVQMRAGSPAAVERVRARVRRVLRFRGYRIPAEERRDLEQEVMRQLWQAVNRTGFDPALGFRKFVEVVTARRCIDWLRAQREEAQMPPEIEDGDSPLRSVLGRERLRLARAALAQLDEPCRELVSLRVGRGKSYRELSELLGRSPGALRVQMHRCLARARAVLADMESAGRSGDSEAGEG